MSALHPRRLAPLLLLALAACGDDSGESVVTPDLLELRTNQLVIGLEHYLTVEGVRRAHLLADSALFAREASTVELRNVRLTFYDGDGKVSSILTSREGVYDWETGDMTATENVVVLDPEKGRRMETTVLHYDRAREQIWSDQPSRMYEADGTVVEGESFESDPGLDEVNLESARLVRPGAS